MASFAFQMAKYFAGNDISKSFIKQVRLNKTMVPGVKSIIYGNEHYGYFETTAFTTGENSLEFEILPPGYQYPIEFFVKRTCGVTFCYEKKEEIRFKSPVPKQFNKVTADVTTGRFTANYILRTGFLEDVALGYGDWFKFIGLNIYNLAGRYQVEKARVFFYILNKNNEVVWAFIPSSSGEIYGTGGMIKPLGNGMFAYSIRETPRRFYVEIIDYKANSLESGKSTTPFDLHHDFVYRPKGKILSLGQTTRRFASAEGVLEDSKNIYTGDTIVEIDIKTGAHKVLWDSFEMLSPFTENQPNADFMHANSIQQVADSGYLLCSRNLNSLFFLSRDFSEILWSVGSSTRNTFQLDKKDSLYHPHHATLIDANHILVVDNGQQFTRIVKIELSKSKHRARVTQEFRPPVNIHAKIAGSAVELGNKNVVGFFPISDSNQLVLIEFDSQTSKQIGRMEFTRGHRASDRVYPMDRIGTEIPVSFHDFQSAISIR